MRSHSHSNRFVDNLFQVLRTAFEQLMSKIRQCSRDGKPIADLWVHRILGALSRQSYPSQLRVVAGPVIVRRGRS